METYARRSAIVELLKQSGEVRIDDLAERFGVSPNTIRNDLKALHAGGLLRRVRGGAVPLEPSRESCDVSPARIDVNRAAKIQMAQWAAGLVEDGEAIVLDHSSTVYHLATFLEDRQNLTVITNGLEAALLLAKNPSNKVILAANVVSVQSQGLSLVGDLPAALRDGFCASKCFISCSGLSAEQGLSERSVDEATLKSNIVNLAHEVIALVDSTKFGRIDTSRFVRLEQINHLVTDDSIASEQLANVRQVARCRITLAGASTVETLAPLASVAEERRYRIGFANMTEKMVFAQQVRRSLERAAGKLNTVDLLIRDNNLDRQTALENADWFVRKGMDLVIEYQIDARAGNVIMDRFNRATIPVIAVDIPLPGATFYGADNYRAGHLAGEALGHWVMDNWQGHLDLLIRLEAPQVGSSGEARMQGLQDGFESIVGFSVDKRALSIDTPVIFDEAKLVVRDLLPSLSSDARIGIIAINDDVALGALAAFEEASRLHQVAAVGQNADRLGRAALRSPSPAFIGSTRYGPEDYGEHLLNLSLKILRREPVPPAIYNRHVFITRENIDEYYPGPDEVLPAEQSA